MVGEMGVYYVSLLKYVYDDIESLYVNARFFFFWLM